MPTTLWLALACAVALHVMHRQMLLAMLDKAWMCASHDKHAATAQMKQAGTQRPGPKDGTHRAQVIVELEDAFQALDDGSVLALL